MKTHIEKLKEDFFKCACGCNETIPEIYIHSTCHENAPVWVKVVKDKYIILECAECEKEITRFNFIEDKRLQNEKV